MKLMQRFRNAHSTEAGPVILPLLSDVERHRGRARSMSVGTRVDLMFLSLWLIAAAAAAIGMFLFLLYSCLPTIVS